jgi:ubiquinone/menaquinone biosynthesis C-methylase UbiE
VNGRLYDLGVALLERRILGKLRAQLLSPLHGTIVDVGAGTGANLPHFNADANVIALEPDRSMVRRLKAKLARTRAKIEIRAEDDSALEGIAERSVDAVLAMLVLCSVPDAAATLRRMKRVLKPTGTLIVLEHVRSPGTMGKVQDVIAPAWRAVADGCNLNRETKAAIAAAGFDVRNLRTERIVKIAPIQYLLYGTATVP